MEDTDGASLLVEGAAAEADDGVSPITGESEKRGLASSNAAR